MQSPRPIRPRAAKLRGALASGLLGAALALPGAAHAQGAPAYGKGVRLDLNEETGQYFRFITWAQIWARFMETNPGTLVDGEEQDTNFDIGLRRVRFLAYGQVTPEVLVLLHVGINNQTYNGERKPQVFVHEALTEYQVVERALSIGAGLHYWNGVARMNNASTLNFLAIDAPITNFATIEQPDQFARHLGIYAKGKLASLDYRLALNKPFTFSGTPGVDTAAFVPDNDSIGLAGYGAWEFWDSESNLLPYTVGTYLGSKRVFNLGLGFHYQSDATVSLNPDMTPETHDMLLLGADAFLDMPLGGGSALTAYGVFWHYDFGPNYIRNIGIMNPGTGGTSVNGPGNAYPSIGTGEHIYGQVGYLLPGTYGGTQLQPYATGQVSLLEAVDDPAITFELGFNWLIVGHTAKITPHYRNRPIYAAQPDGKPVVDERASEFIIQSHMYF